MDSYIKRVQDLSTNFVESFDDLKAREVLQLT